MDYKEAIEELESLHRHCSDMIDEFDPESVWRADCKALDVAISAMQELQEHKNKLEQVYGKCEGLLDKVIDTLVKYADEMKIGNPVESVLLTDEEVELWKQIEKLGTLEEVRKAMNAQDANARKWIPADNPPETDKTKMSDYILLSFENFSVPLVGIYELDEEGNGAYYVGDNEKSCISQELFVNAWMPLPEPYRGGQNE